MSLSKAFIDKFKKEYGCEIQPIPEDEIFDTHGFKLSGKIEKGDKTLYIAYLGRGRLSTYTSYKEELSLLEDDLPEISFILIFKSDKSDQNYVYELKDGKITSSSKTLKEITDEFRNIGLTKSVMSNIIDDVWRLIEHTSGDDRALFINLIMCLLHRTDIPVTSHKKYGSLSLSEFMNKYLELNAAEEYEEATEFARSIDKKSIYDGMVRLIKQRGQDESRNADIEKKIDDIRKNNERTILWLIMEIYRKLYKPYVHSGKDDFGELFNQVETKWMPEGRKSQGQIYSPTHIKELALALLTPHLEKGTKHVIFDPTCGQGGFTLQFAKYCDDNDLVNDVVIYQNEKDKILSDMIFMRAICLYKTRIETLNQNVFSIPESDIPRGTVTMLLMNPPFGMNKGGKQIFPSDFNWQEEKSIRGADNIKLTEWTFLRYSLWRFCKVGAWFFFVIPTSCISENKQNHWDKQQFLRECRLDHVINLREDIFKGQNGGKAVALLVGQYLGGTKDVDDKNFTRLTDLSDDGGILRGKNSAYEYENGTLEKLWKEKLFNDVDKWPKYDKTLLRKSKVSKDDSENEIISRKSKRKQKGSKNDDSEDEIISRKSKRKQKGSKEDETISRKSKRSKEDETISRKSKRNKDDDSEDETESNENNSTDEIISRKSKEDDEMDSYDSITASEDICNEYYIYKILAPNSNWIFKHITKISDEERRKAFYMSIVNRTQAYMTNIVNAFDYKSTKKSDDPKCEWREIKISDLFELVKGLKTFDFPDKDDKHKGIIPLISASSFNNGISTYINEYSYDTAEHDNIPVLTVAGFGSSGETFVQTGKFAVRGHGSIMVIKPKLKYLQDIDILQIVAHIMKTEFATKLYSYQNALNNTRLMNETIKLPFNKETNKIDFSLAGDFDTSHMEVTRDVKVTDLFEIIGRGKTSTISTLKDGKYPLISCTGHNNGIVRFVDKYDYDGDYITIASNGDATAGYSFVQHGKFITTAGVLLLKPKDSKLIPILSELALAMTMEFRRKYSFNHALSVDRLKSEVIHQLPFKPTSKGDFELDIEGIRYIYI